METAKQQHVLLFCRFKEKIYTMGVIFFGNLARIYSGVWIIGDCFSVIRL